MQTSPLQKANFCSSDRAGWMKCEGELAQFRLSDCPLIPEDYDLPAKTQKQTIKVDFLDFTDLRSRFQEVDFDQNPEQTANLVKMANFG